ncbi:uncharacterized protein LOC110460232 [Mizuhopecten yessoensis]|uniref:uncharacterized protein LOC110460232 n=1 Tax=Mizuhopecten yessoensis TaxID=6573 RepID=UPI000B457A34|nr:uncharacterized protein LOC110460232 [Mizuhopecten yessoensis]
MEFEISPLSYVDNEASPEDKVVTRLFEEVWSWRLKTSPEFASYCGVHDDDDKLDDIGLEALKEWKITVEKFLERCREINTDAISDAAKLDLALLKEEFKTFLLACKFNGWCFPITFQDGIHNDIHLLLSFSKFEKEADFKVYIERLKCYPRQISQAREMCEEGIKIGYVNHMVSMREVPDQINSLTNNGKLDPKASPFLSPFRKEVDGISPEEMAELEKEAISVLEDTVIPAFIDLRDYLMSVYMRRTRPSIGCCTLPNGQRYYQQCLMFHTSTNLTPQEVHNLGLQEVERITKAMEQIAKEEGLGSNIQRFLRHAKDNKELYYQTEEDLLAGIKDICTNKIRPKLSKLFKTIPDVDMKITAAPASMSSAPVGFYMAGTNDGSRPGIYYVNTSHFSDTPIYELMALSLHEGEPGHHLQSMYAIQQKGMPAFRQYIEDMKYSRAPTRFSLHTAYMEGWGLYCESLGEELGLYSTNYELFGRYTFEILRAARLVVDTGLHAMGWSLESTKKYLIERAFMHEWFADSESKRYVTWPGQACAYKIGELKIKELRKRAEKELGDAFDVREFHEAILQCGPVPLNVLEGMITAYIKDTKNLNNVEDEENSKESD